MAAIKTGDNVRLVQPVITGHVMKTEYDEDTQALKHLVQYKDNEGNDHERWFAADSLEVTK